VKGQVKCNAENDTYTHNSEKSDQECRRGGHKLYMTISSPLQTNLMTCTQGVSTAVRLSDKIIK
jgi:hypothetical protein